jgi:hypothetical protein
MASTEDTGTKTDVEETPRVLGLFSWINDHIALLSFVLIVVGVGIAIILTVLIVGLSLRSVRYSVVTVVPILLVVAWVWGYMWLRGHTINPITGTVAAIAVGVGSTTRPTSPSDSVRSSRRSQPIPGSPQCGRRNWRGTCDFRCHIDRWIRSNGVRPDADVRSLWRADGCDDRDIRRGCSAGASKSVYRGHTPPQGCRTRRTRGRSHERRIRL